MSASSLHRHLICAGSRGAESGLPSLPPSQRQLDGDRAHLALQGVLDGSLQLDGVVDDIRPAVKVAVDYVLNITKEGGWKLATEIKLDPSRIFKEEGHGGSADIVLTKDDNLIVIDYKHGESREVLANGNKQLLAYAAGAVTDDIKLLSLVIIQPRIWFGPKIKEWNLDKGDIQEEWAKIAARLKEIKGSVIKTPTAEACFGCRAKLICQSRLRHVEEVTMDAFQEVNGAGGGISALSDPQIAAFLDTQASMKSVYADIEEEANLRIKAGKTIPGWKLVAGRGARKWALDDETMEKKLKNMKIPKNIYLVSKLVSPAQAEKLDCLSDKQIKNLKGMVSIKEGSPKLVTESTTGDAIVYDCGAAFADLPSTECQDQAPSAESLFM